MKTRKTQGNFFFGGQKIYLHCFIHVEQYGILLRYMTIDIIIPRKGNLFLLPFIPRKKFVHTTLELKSKNIKTKFND